MKKPFSYIIYLHILCISHFAWVSLPLSPGYIFFLCGIIACNAFLAYRPTKMMKVMQFYFFFLLFILWDDLLCPLAIIDMRFYVRLFIYTLSTFLFPINKNLFIIGWNKNKK